jgi:hypothetical protein
MSGWGAHAPSRVVFGTLAKDMVGRPFHAVSDEGVGNDMRGRMCSPEIPRHCTAGFDMEDDFSGNHMDRMAIRVESL